jgi:hypothetical protein
MKLQYLFLPAILWVLSGCVIVLIPPTTILTILLGIALVNLSLGLTLHLWLPLKIAIALPLVFVLLLVALGFSAVTLVNTLLIGAIGLLTYLLL